MGGVPETIISGTVYRLKEDTLSVETLNRGYNTPAADVARTRRTRRTMREQTLVTFAADVPIIEPIDRQGVPAEPRAEALLRAGNGGQDDDAFVQAQRLQE